MSDKEKVQLTLTHQAKRINETFRAATDEDMRQLQKVVEGYPEFQHLLGCPIKFLLRLKPQKSKGRIILGKAKACSETEELLHHYRFVITIDEGYWMSSPEKREALLFHELMHCGFTAKGKPTTWAHDIEEFFAVFKRFGDWKGEGRILVNQLSFFDERKPYTAPESLTVSMNISGES